MTALLSIKPEHVEAIARGEKRFEFRRRGFARRVDTVLVYATAPVMRLVMVFQAGTIMRRSPPSVWRTCRAFSGLTKGEFDKYFSGTDEAIAISIDSFVSFDQPIDPDDVFEGFVAPQSFRYVDADELPEEIHRYVALARQRSAT